MNRLYPYIMYVNNHPTTRRYASKARNILTLALWRALYLALFCAVIGVLQGCVNIKATLPSPSYYSLSNIHHQTYTCNTTSSIGLDLDIPPYLNTTQIPLYTAQAQATTLAHARWFALPLALIQNVLESNARSRCIVLSTIGAHPLWLRIKLREMGITEEDRQAIVIMDYTLLQGSSIQKMHTFVATQHASKNDETSLIQALQSALASALQSIQLALCDDTNLCKTPSTSTP